MSTSKIITILVAIGTACMATATSVQVIDPTWGIVLTVIGVFLTTFTKSILDTEKKDDK
jgi:steroid 5-alpha reductase family enzyme